MSGFSGIGKSSLIHELHKPVVENRGFFISGKYDQFKKNIPYSAIASAFQDLMRSLFLQSEKDLDNWKNRLKSAVGVNGQIIVDIVPEIVSLIGPQPAVTKLEGVEAQSRFNQVFQDFMGVFTQAEHPLVLFMDDLQWADMPTLSLLKSILNQDDQKYLLLIGAYRDNEVDPTHPLMLLLEEMQKSRTVQSINLGPLQKKDVTQLLCDAFKEKESEVQSLSQLLMEKTYGNPFFVSQFLQTLHQDQLIHFSIDKNRWIPDLEKIKALGVTENVVDLMIRKLQRLPQATQEALKLGAALGNTFSIHTLAVISQKPVSQIASDLWPAVQAELLIPLGNSARIMKDLDYQHQSSSGESLEIKFLHDRVQQGAYSLIEKDQKDKLHLSIGQILLKNLSSNEASLDEALFEIVGHLNIGRNLITDTTEKMKALELNMKAALKAKAAVAFKPYLEFVLVAKELLPKNPWETNFLLTQTVYLELAEARYFSTQFEDIEEILRTLEAKVKDIFIETRICSIWMLYLYSQKRLVDVTKVAVRTVKKLGVSFPDVTKLKEIHIIREVMGGKLKMTFFKVENLKKLPPMVDPRIREAIRILQDAGPATAQGVPLFFPILNSRCVILSIKYGNHPVSATAYALYAIVLVKLGQLGLARRFQETAFEVQEMFGTPQTRAGLWGPSAFFLFMAMETVQRCHRNHEPGLHCSLCFRRLCNDGNISVGTHHDGVF